MTMTGTVTAFEWTNPHSYIEIDVPDDKGGVKHWSIEMGSPSILQQSGWKFQQPEEGRQDHADHQSAEERPSRADS